MITLTTPVPIPNCTRVEVTDVTFDEDNDIAAIRLKARTAPAANLASQVTVIQVKDGNGTAAKMSEKVARAATPAGLEDVLVMVPAVNIVNGYTNLKNAWYGAANTKGARRNAAETQGLAAGWIDSSLVGTVA